MPNMVKSDPVGPPPGPEEIAAPTCQTLICTAPATMPGVVFLEFSDHQDSQEGPVPQPNMVESGQRDHSRVQIRLPRLCARRCSAQCERLEVR